MPDASAKLRPFCPDRPGKSTGACTLDAGHIAYEVDLFDASFLRQAGSRVDTYVVANPTLKYGLTPSAELELNLAPYVLVRTHDGDPGAAPRVAGVGDLYGRVKLNLLGNDDGAAAIAVIPYFKAPTARRGLGDRAWEGGLIVPLAFKLSPRWTLTLDPELDVLKNSAGGGYHLNAAQVVSLARALPHDVTVSAELWGDRSWDPAGAESQYSADVAIAWGLGENLQLDAGLNFGLNRQTPGVQVYAGVAQRF